ncbi:hypothetical protein V1264_017346 [Littorina saxatilis]|uniref:Uncharacterized protein n=1 Tax=Littorina saxatilis TaxID=31220 RepID=A0AAN9BH80_9CAEN
MHPRRHLNLVDRGRALAWVQEGIRLREIAARLGCSHSVIVRLRQRFLATGSVETRPRSGRPRSTTQHTLHHTPGVADQDDYCQHHQTKD